MKDAFMRILGSLKLYRQRRQALRELADERLNASSVSELASIVDDGTDVVEYSGLSNTTYPGLISQDGTALTAQHLDTLMSELHTASQPQPTVDQMKMDIIKKKLGA